jgi:putative pyruvate formate lyase activating enzyme
MENCKLCPRECNAPRGENSGSGVCGSGTLPRVARAALHFGEEPVISGTRGSGTVFFRGCALRCVYCQNGEISLRDGGTAVTVERLRGIYAELIAAGAHNINLVTASHCAESVLQSLTPALSVPVAYNTGGYERVETLRRFDGKIQIYMPDLKYALTESAARYSSAPDYPEVARRAIAEMYRQTGDFAVEDGILRRGVLIRHLVLPENLENTRRVIDWVSETFAPGQVLFSLMSQYTPHGDLRAFPELRRPLTEEEYEAALGYLEESDIEDGFTQELGAAGDELLPRFDGAD